MRSIDINIPGVHDGGRAGSKRGASVPNPRGSEELPAFRKGLKGKHPGAERAGDNKIDGYPDRPVEGDGHPGVHQP